VASKVLKVDAIFGKKSFHRKLYCCWSMEDFEVVVFSSSVCTLSTDGGIEDGIFWVISAVQSGVLAIRVFIYIKNQIS